MTFWNWLTRRRSDHGWPGYIINGRIRTSTAVLILAFFAISWVHNTYQPAPQAAVTPETAQVVPPGFMPDPEYTWVPRTNVEQRPRTTSSTPTTTTTTTTTTEPSSTETTSTSPTSPTSSPETTGPAPTTLVDPDGAGPLPPAPVVSTSTPTTVPTTTPTTVASPVPGPGPVPTPLTPPR